MQTKAVQTQMKSVKNIRKITKTMEMVSAAKMHREQQRAISGRAYIEKTEELLQNISQYIRSPHQLMLPKSGASTHVLILVASDKGLCGGFNIQLTRELFKTIQREPQLEVITIGKYADKIARKAGCTIHSSFGLASGFLESDISRTIVSVITSLYLNSPTVASVRLIYQKIISGITFEVQESILLPFLYEGDMSLGLVDTHDITLYEPSANAVLKELMFGVLQYEVANAVQESLAAEHTARMVAMKNATDNANSLFADLQLEYNKARQAGITAEISEIVGGASALSD